MTNEVRNADFEPILEALKERGKEEMILRLSSEPRGFQPLSI